MVEAALGNYLNNSASTSLASTAWTTVGRMRLAAGDTSDALEAAKRGQAIDARAEGPALLTLELMNPKLPEAESLIQKYLAGNAKALPEIRMTYARVLLDLQRYAEATAQLQIVTREKPDYPEGWLVLGSLQLQDNQLVQAQTSLERYVALALQQTSEAERNRGLAQAYLSLSQLAEKRKDYAAAEGWLNKIDNASGPGPGTNPARLHFGKPGQAGRRPPADSPAARTQPRRCTAETQCRSWLAPRVQAIPVGARHAGASPGQNAQ
ncbi:tetratricopeptide repeat protein [Polaromonas sp. P2-4]|nr:tetratricopeptide repeat protein [Polaromonas sp. P2-4]